MRRTDFPLSNNVFSHNFGVQAVPAGESIVWVTKTREEEVRYKKLLLQEDLQSFWAATADSVESQREAATLVAASCPRSHPLNAIERNTLTETETPLLAVGRYVQEDLVLIKNDQENGYPVSAGCVCFPAGWSIGEKLNRSLASVHAPVPEFDSQLLDPSLRLFQSLKPGRPVWRNNWGVRASDRLDQLPKDVARFESLAQEVDLDSAAECVFRVEYQTLNRLPISQDVLFTIHTRQTRLSRLSQAEKATLAGVLETCPEATLRYKGIWSMRHALIQYLRET